MSGQTPEKAPAHNGKRPRLVTGVLPPVVGLTIAGVVVACSAALGLAGLWLVGQQRHADTAATGDLIATAIADVLSHAATTDKPIDETRVMKLRSVAPFTSVEWRDAAGTLRYRWPRAGEAGQDEPRGRVRTTAPVTTAADEPAGVVTVTLAPLAATAHQASFLTIVGVSCLLALLVHALVFRHLRRHARPLEAIEENLTRYAAGIEQELRALTLGDALGAVAQSWNRLLHDLTALQQPTCVAAGDGASITEQAVARFENRALRGILDSVPVGVLRFGHDETLKYANTAALRLLGRTAEQEAPGDLPELLGPDGAPLVDQIRAQPTRRHTLDRTFGEGEHARSLRLQALPAVGGHDGEPLLLVHDISHLKEAEQARDQFLYHVTHELRTPLTNIHAYAETLSQPDFDDEQTRKECYNVIISETLRLSSLVEDILSLSQLELGSLRIEWGDVDLTRLLRSKVQDNLGHADEKQIELVLSLPPKLPNLRGDKHRLAVLLSNVIGNAVKYTPAEGRIEVLVTAGEQWVQIAVKDNGPGIAEADQARVFEKFYRASSAEVQAVKGTGLGLAIAREVARLHGGDIHLDSTPGEGTTFTIELPTNTDKSG